MGLERKAEGMAKLIWITLARTLLGLVALWQVIGMIPLIAAPAGTPGLVVAAVIKLLIAGICIAAFRPLNRAAARAREARASE